MDYSYRYYSNDSHENNYDNHNQNDNDNNKDNNKIPTIITITTVKIMIPIITIS